MIHLPKTFSKAWWLTAGADTFVGGASADVFNALSIKADGSPGATLTGFDSIDGGAGNDTLNIYTGNGFNASLPTNLTVKNVETINYLNAEAGVATIDVSKFVGATTINQTGFAGDLINLAATTKAVFTGVTARYQDQINVGAADTATSATIVLDGVKGSSQNNVASVNVSGAALDLVTISGSLLDTSATADAAKLDLDVTAGVDVKTVSVNTAFATNLEVSNASSSTKYVSTVDTSAGAGAVTFVANDKVANIKTGTGKDEVTLQTALTADAKAASVSTGEGDDKLTIIATAAAASAATVTADAGAGDDAINLTINSDITYNVAGGAGNDTVVITGTVKTTDKIDGGAGTDTVSLAAKAAYVADDYIVLNKVLSNFETLKLTGGTVTTLDASQLATGYTTIDINAGSAVTKVGTQALIANGNVTATANGFVLDTDIGTAGNQTTYAGALSITEKLGGTVNAFADSAALTVTAGTAGVAAILAGDVKTASVSLVNSVNDATTPTADTIASVTVGALATGTGVAGLTTLTLTGNGSATVYNGAADKLTSVDASGLGGVLTLGENKDAAITGLTYSSANSAAETIKLGAGLDTVTLGVSTYGKVDVVSGLNLVLDTAGTDLDATKSDFIKLADAGAALSFAKFTTTQTDLDLALKDAAASSLGDNLVFQMSGNTYIYQDKAAAGNVTNTIDANDTVIQLSGLVNLDALAISLHQAA